MQSQTAITSFICCLLLGASAVPLEHSFTRRSQTFGLGDIGGINRDESNNFSATTYGDALGQGVGNEFSPKSIVGGIGGAAGLIRRSQVDSHGNVGSVNRDESFNFESETMGDSVNNGVGNVFTPSSFVDGVGQGILFKRSQVIEKHGNVEINRDESRNLASETYGDSVNSGANNAVGSFSLVNGLGLGSRPLIRRSQVVSNEGDVRINRDESNNYSFETLGDSLNQGIQNSMSPASIVNGISSTGLIRRSQIVSNEGDVRINRDESNNYSFETLGDSLNQGIENSMSPTSIVNGLGGARLIKRSQVINKVGNTGINRDESLNSGVSSVGNSVNSGWDNRVGSFDGRFGTFGDFPRSRLFGRSQTTQHGNIKAINRDESYNFASNNFQDAINTGLYNVMSPTNLVEDVGSSFLVRRSQEINKFGNNFINRDESQNQFSSAVGNSVNNRVAPGAFANPRGGFWRRSQVINKQGDNIINRDESRNQFDSSWGNSFNDGFSNRATPAAFGRFFKRSQGVSHGNVDSVNRDESTNFDIESYGDAINDGIDNTFSPSNVVNGLGGLGLLRRSQVVENKGSVQINRDESTNFASDTYGDSVNNGVGNVMSPLSLVNGLAGGSLV